jgi:hypothetical protein
MNTVPEIASRQHNCGVLFYRYPITVLKTPLAALVANVSVA